MFQGDSEFAFDVPWAGIVDVLATHFAKQFRSLLFTQRYDTGTEGGHARQKPCTCFIMFQSFWILFLMIGHARLDVPIMPFCLFCFGPMWSWPDRADGLAVRASIQEESKIHGRAPTSRQVVSS